MVLQQLLTLIDCPRLLPPASKAPLSSLTAKGQAGQDVDPGDTMLPPHCHRQGEIRPVSQPSGEAEWMVTSIPRKHTGAQVTKTGGLFETGVLAASKKYFNICWQRIGMVNNKQDRMIITACLGPRDSAGDLEMYGSGSSDISEVGISGQG